MKRILSTLLVLFICLGITACRNSSQKKTEIRDVFQMNPVMLDENFMGISAMRATENAVFLLGAMQNEDSDSTAVAKYDLQQESVTYTSLSDIEYASNFAASDDMLVFLHTSYDELGEKVFASSYDNDGKPLWRINITESIDSEVYVDEIYAVTYGSVCYLGIKDTLFMITEDGNNSIMRKFESTIIGLFEVSGNIHVYGLQYHYVYYPESGQYVLSEEWQKGLSEASGRDVYFTNEDDGFYYITEESLNKYNIQNGDCLTVMNWVNSGIAYDVDPTTKKKTFNEKEAKSLRAKEERDKIYTNGSVHGFTSPRWTLEYCIAMSCISGDFHKAVHYGKKILNAQEYISLTDAKIDEANRDAEAEAQAWDVFSPAERAYHIYNLMLDGDGKSNLKAIVAQCLASLLHWKISIIPGGVTQEKMFDLDLYGFKTKEEAKATLKSEIEVDPYLSYIVNAIKYAAGETV